MSYKLSIVIPHYNNIKSLKRLLLSIPDNDDIQVIIVDDYSPAAVKTQYFQLRDEFDRNRYFFMENHSGVHNAGAARNIGLQYVQGDWLLFADADDYFLDGFYDTVSRYFDKEYDLIYFKLISIYSDTGESSIRHLSYNNRVDNYLSKPNRKYEIQIRTNWDVPFAKLIRTKTVKGNNIQFDEISVSNDKFFSTQIGFYARKITASKETIYCVTRNRGSLTTKLDFKSFETRMSVEIKQNNFLKQHLSRQDFAYIGRFTAYTNLYLIIRRNYGIKIFFKYLKLFAQNHMLSISLKGIRSDMFPSFIRSMQEENKIKRKYTKTDDNKADSRTVF